MNNETSPEVKALPKKEMLQDETDRDEKEKEKVRQGERRFTQRSAREGKTVDLLGQDSGKYSYRVKYTLPPWAFKNEVIIMDGWGGMEEVPISQLNLEENEDQEEKKKKKTHRGDRRFVRKA